MRPDIAVHQRKHEQPPQTGTDTTTGTGSGTEAGTGTGTGAGKGSSAIDIAFTRFYGVKTLSSDKIAMDFKNIADEVIANLREQGIDLIVKIEIEAVDSAGFDESRIRTVSENAKTLKFDQSGFEKS